MDAVVVFPVYALADDRSMFLVESPARVLYHIEPIDIENKEYLFWDADGRGVRISLKGETVHAIEHTDNDLSLQEAFKLYSEAYGLSTDTTGPIAEVIKKTFGDFKTFQEKFNVAGVGQFGSGWVWLAGDSKGEVKILSTPNQDSPLSQSLYPIFGNDVWEHAYYLKYNNRRPEYLQAWWSVVNWEEVNKRYQSSIKK